MGIGLFMMSCMSFHKEVEKAPGGEASESQILDAKLKAASEKSVKNRETIVVPDEVIKKNIGTSFRKTKSLAPRDIHLIIRQGEVIVRGKVGSVAEKKLVDAVVRTSHGIRKVDNRLRVVATRENPWPKGDERGLGEVVHDRQIKDAVRRKLARMGKARLSQMNIEVYLGVVVLSGPVQSEEVRKKIYSTALFIPKVRAVIDNTWVETDDAVEDDSTNADATP